MGDSTVVRVTSNRLGVELARSNSSATLSYMRGLGFTQGADPLRDTLLTADAALSSFGNADTTRAIIVFTAAGDECRPRDAVLASIRDIRSRGTPTIVVGFGMRDAEIDVNALEANFYAVAGGLPRVGAREEYYSSLEPEAIEETLDRVLIRPTLCRVRAPTPLEAPVSQFALRTRNWEPIRHDPGRQDGWDWIDAASGRIEVFGAACDRIVAQRSTLTLVTSESSCVAD